MSAMASQIISLTIVYSTVYSGAYQGKYQSSASLAFVRRIHRSSVNSPHKWPVMRKKIPFDDVIMYLHFISIIVLGWCFLTMKTASCHDTNFIVIYEAVGSYRATNDDRIVIKAMIITNSGAPSDNKWHHEISLVSELTHLHWTKWSPFRRRYFQMHFRYWKSFYFD